MEYLECLLALSASRSSLVKPEPYHEEDDQSEECSPNGSGTGLRKNRYDRRPAASLPDSKTEQCATSQTDDVAGAVRKPDCQETIMVIDWNDPA